MPDSLLDQYLAPPEQSTGDPVRDDMLRESRQRAMASVVTATGAPEQVARARQIANDTGVPLDTAVRQLPTLEAQRQQADARSLFERYPAIGKWAVEPSHAAMAQGDWGKLGKVAAYLSVDHGPAARVYSLVGQGVASLWGQMNRFADAVTSVTSSPVSDFFLNSIDPSRDPNKTAKQQSGFYRSQASQSERYAAIPIPGTTPWSAVPSPMQMLRNPASIGKLASFAAESSITSAPGTAFAVLNPIGAGMANTGGIAQQRAINSNRTTATLGDILKAAPAGAISTFLDRFGFESIIGATGKNALIRTIKAAGSEAATEFTQGVIENAGGTVGTDRGFNTAEALDQGLQGAVGSLGTSLGLRVPMEAVRPFTHSMRATEEGAFLDGLMDRAADSNVRKIAPDAFAKLLGNLTEGTPAENVFVPAAPSAVYFT